MSHITHTGPCGCPPCVYARHSSTPDELELDTLRVEVARLKGLVHGSTDAIAEEREACARIADAVAQQDPLWSEAQNTAAADIAADIRARGGK